MDEDNEKQLEEPKISLPKKEISLEQMNDIKKQRAKIEEKQKEDKISEEEKQEELYQYERPEDLKEEAKAAINRAQEIKSTYQEMAQKIENERREREVRLEEMKTQEEDRTPNAKGSLLKDIAIIAIILGALLGIAIIFMGNYAVGIGIVIIGSLFCAVTLGISEVIRLLQLIYDLLYFERYGKKRK